MRYTPDEALRTIDEMRASGHLIVGIDEAGRGSIAGPVTAGACVTPKAWPLELRDGATIDDSKRLSPHKREIAFEWIQENCIWAVNHVPSTVIDREGMSRALGFAWNEAFASLRDRINSTNFVVVVDGSTHSRFTQWTQVIALPKADSLVPEVAAASICAKVTRDHIMVDLSKEYLDYECWKGNKGYGTPDHWEALAKYGPTMEHRISFKGVRDSGKVRSHSWLHQMVLDEAAELV